MKRTLRFGVPMVICLLVILGGGFALWHGQAQASGGDHQQEKALDGKQNVGYFIEWGVYARNYLVKNVVTSGQARDLTTLDYAFANINASNQCAIADAWADYQKPFTADQTVNGVADDTSGTTMVGNFNQLKQLKALYPHLKVMISIGGWTGSTNFSSAAAPQNVAGFVSSCIDMFIKGNLPGLPAGAGAGIFDGIDIDWEYPNNPGAGHPYGPQDIQNYTNLLREFRSQFEALGEQTHQHYLLTTDTPSGQDKYNQLQLRDISRSVDWLNLLTFDMHGAFNPTGPTDFAAPIYADPKDPSPAPANTYSVNHAVTDYLRAGVPAHKIVIAIPFYGQGWTNVPNVNNGLYQSSPAMQPAPATYVAGTDDYKILKALSGYTGYHDPLTKGFYIFNGTTFWTFDDATTVATKMHYINHLDLGGAMAWSLDGDDGTLENTIFRGLADHDDR